MHEELLSEKWPLAGGLFSVHSKKFDFELLSFSKFTFYPNLVALDLISTEIRGYHAVLKTKTWD